MAAGSAAPLIPRATYRLQLNAGFGFRQAAGLVPYLAALGVSHVYCSPYFRARPGSMHGYDVVDHNRFNPEIGTRDDFAYFVDTLRTHGMGHILDFVPNHVGVMGAENEWWMDVLENGTASRYAEFFDIDWSPPNPALAGKLLVPVLGEPYGWVLERGELRLTWEEAAGSFAVFYHEHRFPLDPRTYPAVLEAALTRPGSPEPSSEHRLEMEALITALLRLPDRTSPTAEQVHERERDTALHKRRLRELVERSPPLASALAATVTELNGTAGEPGSFDALHRILEDQSYRLAYWRVAADDINYRRFFDINDLAALRMENPRVFETTHRLLLTLIREGHVDGVRIDHPDGLYDPADYFRRLQQAAAEALAAGSGDRRAPGQDGLPIYLLAEKILANFERLPTDWPVHGTTGYNFANVLAGVFVDARARGRMDRIYRAFIRDDTEWQDVVYDSKVLVLRSALSAELNVLANQLARIARSDRHSRDFTLSNLRQALTEVIAHCPVYRTYVTGVASEDDRRYINWAIAKARRRGAPTDAALLDFVRRMMLADGSGMPDGIQAEVRTFAGRLQQVTAPVAAKGVEDTALYRFTRLVSLNEVGGEPESFGVSVRQFHADAAYRGRHWPHELLASSTHDTKRSEDVRARISVLSEMPTVWRRALGRWSRMTRSRRRLVDDLPAPGPHAEYLLYQILLGTWPLGPMDESAWGEYGQRIEAYLVKACREAKRRTSWANVNREYEEAVVQFARLALETREENRLRLEIADLAATIAPYGFLNGLAQTLCKLTAPGVPDLYQGTELWDDSLVDPDNRRPVDYGRRKRLLEEVQAWPGAGPELVQPLASALGTLEDGRCKLHVTFRALAFRQRCPALFRDGAYLPLRCQGSRSGNLLAFARVLDGQCAVVAVPRLCTRLYPAGRRPGSSCAEWGDTVIRLPRHLDRGLENLLDGLPVPTRPLDGKTRGLPAAELLARFPVALLAG